MKHPKFQIFASDNGEFFFRLTARNGEIILASEGYNSIAGARKGIKAVKTNAVNAENFTHKPSSDGQYFFTLSAANGKVIGKSELFTSKTASTSSVNSVIRIAADAPVEELVDELMEGRDQPLPFISTENFGDCSPAVCGNITITLKNVKVTNLRFTNLAGGGCGFFVKRLAPISIRNGINALTGTNLKADCKKCKCLVTETLKNKSIKISGTGRTFVDPNNDQTTDKTKAVCQIDFDVAFTLVIKGTLGICIAPGFKAA